eukprot:jgi/Orpsp1_1/1185075/evm.model.c7180000092224.1
MSSLLKRLVKISVFFSILRVVSPSTELLLKKLSTSSVRSRRFNLVPRVFHTWSLTMVVLFVTQIL